MKTNWQTKKLGDLCVIELGKTPYRGNKKFWDAEKQTKNVWLSIADLLNTDGNIVSDSKEYISDEGAKLSKIIKRGTLLVSFKLTLGRLAFAGKDLYTNEAIAALTIKDEKEISKDYLYHYLNFFDWHAAVKGDIKVKGKTLNKAKLKEIEISYPESLAEQKRIVGILDEVFGGIEKARGNAEKNLKNSRELFESYLQSVFANPGKDWEERTLKEIGRTQTGLTPKTGKNEYYGDFVPFITPADINILGDGVVRYDGRGLSEEGLKAGRKIENNSVLMVCIGATIGKVGFSEREVSCNQQINTLTPENKYDAKLFYYILSTKTFYNKVIKSSSQATLPIINKGKWENLSVLFPKSLFDQKAIVKKLDALAGETKKLEEIYRQKLANLAELKKSVLKKAFSGEL